MAHETTDQLLAELSDYWDKHPDSNLYKLFEGFNIPLQELGQNLKKIRHWQALKNAKGSTLDLFGKDIQTYRTSKNDDDFRFMIHLNELLSRAQGTIPSINHIVTAALQANDGDVKVYKKDMPRHFGLEVPLEDVQSVDIERFLINNRQRMAALGYWLDGIRFKLLEKFHLFYGVYASSSDLYDILGNPKEVVHVALTAKPMCQYVGTHTQSSDEYELDNIDNSIIKLKEKASDVTNYAGAFSSSSDLYKLKNDNASVAVQLPVSATAHVGAGITTIMYYSLTAKTV